MFPRVGSDERGLIQHNVTRLSRYVYPGDNIYNAHRIIPRSDLHNTTINFSLFFCWSIHVLSIKIYNFIIVSERWKREFNARCNYIIFAADGNNNNKNEKKHIIRVVTARGECADLRGFSSYTGGDQEESSIAARARNPKDPSRITHIHTHESLEMCCLLSLALSLCLFKSVGSAGTPPLSNSPALF